MSTSRYTPLSCSCSTECEGTNSSTAQPKADSMSVATGSIRKFWGITGRSLTQVRSIMLTPTACISPPITGWVAGCISFSSSSTISAMPVPNTAALIRHSATPLRTLFFLKSSSRCWRSIAISSGFWSWTSSLMSKNLPRPKVASSNSATDDSTACCSAGEMICERSVVLVLSSADHWPRQSL